MPTVGKVVGNNLRILLEDAIINCEDGFSLNVEGEEIDVSCKGSGNWGDTLPGTKSWSVDVSAKLVYDSTTNGYFNLLTNMITDVEYDIEIGTYVNDAVVSGDKYITGTVVVTSISMDSNNNEAATWTATLAGRGPLAVLTRD